MLIDTTRKITSVNYSEVERRLTLHYNDGSMESYEDVPKEVYESIRKSGGMINESVGSTLSGFRKIQSV